MPHTALASRLKTLEKRLAPADPYQTLPACIADWQRGTGPVPVFRCFDRVLWGYFCIQDRPRRMSDVLRQIDAIDVAFFNLLLEWEPGLPLDDVEAGSRFITDLGRRSIGWKCLLLNFQQLKDCLRRHRQSLTFNGDLDMPYEAREVMLADTVRQLRFNSLTEAEHADPFLSAHPCHPWP